MWLWGLHRLVEDDHGQRFWGKTITVAKAFDIDSRGVPRNSRRNAGRGWHTVGEA